MNLIEKIKNEINILEGATGDYRAMYQPVIDRLKQYLREENILM